MSVKILTDMLYLDLGSHTSVEKSGAISEFACSLLDGINSTFLYLQPSGNVMAHGVAREGK
jgi:hypothetical protein